MRFNIFAIAGLLLSTVVIAAPVDLSARSDEVLDDLVFAREPAGNSRIPRYVGAAGIRRPRAPTPNSMRYPRNRGPISPPNTPPRSRSPRRGNRPSRIPIRRGSNLRNRSEEAEDEILAREPAGQSCKDCIRQPRPRPKYPTRPPGRPVLPPRSAGTPIRRVVHM